MIIESLKFLHIVLILSLTGATVYGLVLVGSNSSHQAKILLLNRYILWVATFAILTGTLLVYPKNFTFHTDWIQTVYVLLALFTGTLGLLVWLVKKHYLKSQRLWFLAYLFLAGILIIAIHDAVTKTTLL